ETLGQEKMMSAASSAVSDMLVTVKSREVQRGMLAEMRGDRDSSIHHFLAAAHLELVLASDYDAVEDSDLALRSRLSAASCFWRAGQPERARSLIDQLSQSYPSESTMIQKVLEDLEGNVSSPTS
ncbi:MAG TPA: hypothetical protein VFF52_20290, partial [Isosphaeraceae bacterium]|nr:hypothetical protein [Isosphaeraceae bacterium]